MSQSTEEKIRKIELGKKKRQNKEERKTKQNKKTQKRIGEKQVKQAYKQKRMGGQDSQTSCENSTQ